MSKIITFEDLQRLGANTIHEHTHIARSKLELLLSKSYAELNRVQFMGFVSILEREYSIDLAELREEYDIYVQVNPEVTIPKDSVIFQSPSNKRKWWMISGIVAIAVLIAVVVLTQRQLSSLPTEEIMVLQSSEINISKPEPMGETNTSVDANISEGNQTQLPDQNMTLSQTLPTQTFGHAVRITPVSKVWVGIMDLQSGAKTQKITKDPIVIDTSKNWLFIFGHGRLLIENSDSNKTLEERNTVWFSYENGQLHQLTHDQFRAKNRGSNW